MSFPNVPRQKHFFYDRIWTSNMDSLCLSTILANTNYAVWRPPNEPMPHAITCARAELNRMFGKELSYGDVKDMVAFQKCVCLPESHCDAGKNVVYMHDNAWLKMFREEALTKAYFYEGEPEFRLLTSIFGQHVIKDENQQNIIIISDNTLRVSEHDQVRVEASEDDEVTSPILRRRLFDDRESTNRGSASHNFPMANAFPPQPQGSDFSYYNAGNSSCASSDPFNSDHKNFK